MGITSEDVTSRTARPVHGVRRLEVWVPAVYALCAGAWIVLSDLIVVAEARSPDEQAAWSLLKGLGFVVVSAVALHALLRWAVSRERGAQRLVEAGEAALREGEERYRSLFEALRESEEKLALAVEAADMGTWHAVPWGPMECSTRLREILGMDEGDVIDGMDAFLRFVHPDDREAHRVAVLRSLDPAGDGRYRDEYRCLRSDGTVRWISARGIVRFEEKDGVRQAVRGAGTVLDVTERKLAEEELSAEKRRLDETLQRLKAMQSQLMQTDRMASVGVLAAGVAHEINNPLAYLSASLDFLDRELADLAKRIPAGLLDESREALAEAREGAGRVKHVVRDLKTFSRVEEERRTHVELRSVIESSINMVFNEIKYRARLVKDYGRTPPVLANEGRLGQVFLNLLINAAHAITEGRVDENEIRVVTTTDEAGRAVVEVRDTGTGIPADVLDRIFDPFFTTKPVGVGTGLGLSICRNIVAAAGGEVAVQSKVGEGTAFRVTLPAAPPPSESEAMTPRAAASQGRRGRVLVVDDEAAVGAALRRVLAPEHDLTVLTSAAEARDLIARGVRFDVILCDLMMPRMTGMDLHAELEAVAPDQAACMVLLTGGVFTARASQFLDRVPNLRLDKPFDSGSLRTLVGRLVR